MKLILILAFLGANSSYAHVKCLTGDQELKIEVFEPKEKVDQPIQLQLFEKSGIQYALKFQEAVEVRENINRMKVEVTGNKSDLNIFVDGNLFIQQSAEFKLSGKKYSFKCDIED
ncbi:MAG: hypothetical protein KA715_14760 [Xanthomonadaceae bacterium]|nr:hypothetical protein [Xanthomonadaceae bacterium]